MVLRHVPFLATILSAKALVTMAGSSSGSEPRRPIPIDQPEYPREVRTDLPHAAWEPPGVAFRHGKCIPQNVAPVIFEPHPICLRMAEWTFYGHRLRPFLIKCSRGLTAFLLAPPCHPSPQDTQVFCQSLVANRLGLFQGHDRGAARSSPKVRDNPFVDLHWLPC